MAKAFLRAQDVVEIATRRIAELEAAHAAEREEHIAKYEGVPELRGRLWWKHVHVTTRQEAEDRYYGRGDYYSWHCYADGVERYYRRCVKEWRAILETAQGAIEYGDKKVLLDDKEVAMIRGAASREAA